MIRKLTISSLLLLLFVGLYLILSITHIFSICQIKDYSLLPNINKGSFHITSNLKKYTYNDIVYCSYPVSSNNQELVYRKITGLEGDTIELNDGYLLRNRYMVDNPQQIILNYYIKADNVKDFKQFKKLKQPLKIKGDSIILSMNYSEFTELSRYFVVREIVKNRNQKDPGIFGSTNENGWNDHNFGPIVVPKGQCFVLTDNRDNYRDSRHWGCIPLSNIIATLVGK